MKVVRRKINKVRLFGFVLILILLVLSISFGLFKNSSKSDSSNSTKIQLEDNIEDDNTDDTLQYDSVSMIMVGDNLIHESIYKEANKLAGYDGYDFSSMYEDISTIVSNYDIAYYNQETILGGSEIGLSSYPAFNSPYEVGDAMIEAGFNLVSLATNHTLDRGEVAVINSRNYWNSKTDVLAVGSYSNREEANEVQIREINNITYTMLNYTYGTNGISVESGKEYLVNVWPVTGSDIETDSDYQNYKEKVKADIEKVRDDVDVLIVAMHWGTEYEHMPNEYQIDMANYLSNLGVDIIIGTHPHVIQPVSYINDTLVIYSLGNFLSAHEVVNLSNRVGLMVSLNIVKDSDGNVSISNVACELLYTYYTEDYTDFKVIPFSQLDDSYLEGYEDIYNTYKDIVVGMDSSINVNSLSSN